MSDLVARIRAAIDETERVAREAWQGDGWRHEPPFEGSVMDDEVWTGRQAPGHTPIPVAKAWNAATAKHIALNDPARILAMAAAHRKILHLHDRDHECAVFSDGNPHRAPLSEGEVDAYRYVLQTEPCSTVLLLAAAYGITAEERP